MKTLKALKITSSIQILYCVYCLLNTLLLIIGFALDVNICLRIGTFLFYNTVEFSILISPICFIVNLAIYLKERNCSEKKAIIGKKWIRIFVWPIITTIFFLIQIFPFIRIPIFV